MIQEKLENISLEPIDIETRSRYYLVKGIEIISRKEKTNESAST